MKKIMLQKPLAQIPAWMIAMSVLCFFPFGVFLLVLRQKRMLNLAAKSLIGMGMFWSVGILLLVFNTVTQGGTSASDFLTKMVLLIILLGCYVSCGLRLLKGQKEESKASAQPPQQGAPVVCPCCGACNTPDSANQECEYCGMLLPQQIDALHE